MSILALLLPVFIRQSPDLTHAVTLQELAAPAHALCADLGKASGLDLTCDVRIKNDLIVLGVKQRPVGEVMAKIATTFGWEWQPNGKGYRLVPTPEFLHKAKDGRRQILIRDGHRLQALAQERLKEGATRDTVAWQKESERIAELEENDPFSEKGRAMRARLEEVTGFAQGSSGPMYTMIGALTDDQLVRIFTERLSFSTDPEPLQMPMPSAVRKSCEECLAKDTFMGDDAKNVKRVSLSLGGGGGMHLRYIDAKGRVFDPPSHDQDLPLLADLPHPPLAPALKKALGQREIRATQFTQEPLSQYAGWLVKVAETANANVVADAYDWYPSTFGAESGSTEEWLGKLAPIGFTMEGGWIRGRAYDWPRWREEQAPREILTGLSHGFESLTLDEKAALVARLTRIQFESPILQLNKPDFYFYHFWDDAPAVMRQALLAGRSVSLSALPPAGLALLDQGIAQAGELEIFHGTPDEGFIGEPEFGPNTQVSESAEFDSEPADFASLYPHYLAPNASLSAVVLQFPALSFGEMGFFSPQNFASIVSLEPDPTGVKYIDRLFKRPAHVATAQVVQFRFHLAPLPDQKFTYGTLRVGTQSVSSLNDAPADFKKRVQYHEQKAAETRINPNEIGGTGNAKP